MPFCYTVRNVFMLRLRWIFTVIGRTCLFGIRVPIWTHLLTITDSVLSVYASLALIPVITINRWCFGHADFIIFILTIIFNPARVIGEYKHCQKSIPPSSHCCYIRFRSRQRVQVEIST
jgi:hypothetical protein